MKENNIFQDNVFLQQIFDVNPEALMLLNLKGEVVKVNARVEELSGYKSKDILGKLVFKLPFLPEESLGLVKKRLIQRIKGKDIGAYDLDVTRKNGQKLIGSVLGKIIKNDKNLPIGILVVVQDVTEQRQTVKELKKLQKQTKIYLDISEEKKYELKKSEAERRIWLENSPACTKIVDLSLNLKYMSKSGAKDLQVKDVSELYGKPYPFGFYPKVFKTMMTSNLKKAIKTKKVIVQEAPVTDVKGNEIWFHSTIVPVNDDEGKLDYLMVVSIDTTDKNKTEKKLKESEEKAKNLIVKMPNAFALHEMIYDKKGKAIDYKFLDVNPAWEKIIGMKSEKVIGKTLHEIMPKVKDFWIDTYGRVVETGISEEFEQYSPAIGKYFHCYAYRPELGKFAVFFSDTTEKKKVEEESKERINQLESMNKAVVGRELKMIKLKDKIKVLETKPKEALK